MRISHRHKFIFFSAPKTGSTSIRALLDPLSDIRGVDRLTLDVAFHDHARPLETRRDFWTRGWDFESYYRFVLVRNPWRRLASLYAHRRYMRKDFREPFLLWLAKSRPDGEGGGPEPFLRHGCYSLSAFAGDESGNLLVNDVFRLEDIETLPDLLRQRGLPIPIETKVPRKNFTTGTINYRQLYTTEESIELVRTRYAGEIERFGYEFPEGVFTIAGD